MRDLREGFYLQGSCPPRVPGLPFLFRQISSWVAFFRNCHGWQRFGKYCGKCDPHFQLQQLPPSIWKARAARDTMALVAIVLGRKAENVVPSGFVSRSERRLCYQVTAFWTPLFHCRKPGLNLEANSRHLSQVFFFFLQDSGPSGCWEQSSTSQGLAHCGPPAAEPMNLCGSQLHPSCNPEHYPLGQVSPD